MAPTGESELADPSEGSGRAAAVCTGPPRPLPRPAARLGRGRRPRAGERARSERSVAKGRPLLGCGSSVGRQAALSGRLGAWPRPRAAGAPERQSLPGSGRCERAGGPGTAAAAAAGGAGAARCCSGSRPGSERRLAGLRSWHLAPLGRGLGRRTLRSVPGMTCQGSSGWGLWVAPLAALLSLRGKESRAGEGTWAGGREQQHRHGTARHGRARDAHVPRCLPAVRPTPGSNSQLWRPGGERGGLARAGWTEAASASQPARGFPESVPSLTRASCRQVPEREPRLAPSPLGLSPGAPRLLCRTIRSLASRHAAEEG